MITKESIDAALTAHSQWKKRLQEAVEKGKSEFQVNVVQKDNACQFGQWLNTLSGNDTKSEDFIKVKHLHAEFHKTAASILELALSDKKPEALKKLEFGGAYGQITGKLVLALNSWKNKI